MESKSQQRKSIRKRILSVIIVALVVLTLIMGAISIYVVNRISQDDSEQIMTAICDAEALRFDNQLDLVRNSVTMIYEYAEELAVNQGSAYIYTDEYKRQLQDLSLTIANQTEGVCAVYFRYNPELTGSGIDGFWASKQADGKTFKKEIPTNILNYNASDMEHVGWFYVPKATGKPMWMAPYYNQNVDVFMISYIIPVYLKSGEFVGVLGMDIDFNAIMKNATLDNALYGSGKLALVDVSEHVIYYPDNEGNAVGEKLSNALYNHITKINKTSDLLEMTEADGSVSIICCKKLSNGMVMYVNVPKWEITKDRDRLSVIIFMTAIFVMSITFFMIWNRMTKIIEPLKHLTDITNQYAKGEWQENYVCETNDELQELSEGISQMALNTQDYIERIENLARTDALTGLNNKTSYLEYVEMIKKNIHHAYDEYAVVVMDMNLLKKTNDMCGHEAGDILIKEAGRYICKTFAYSPVFRIGGDEFVAILVNEDYEYREQCMKEFYENMGYDVPGIEEIPLFISGGMAEKNSGYCEYEEVFNLADERMYEMKKQMKMARSD